MCGILFTNNQAIGKDRFLAALNLMKYRGPDAAGCYGEFGGSKLGHNRLKILDLDNRSNQPFVSTDGTHQIIFNGEIYNFQELAHKYRLELRTTSDTEVLLKLYLKLGTKMLDELNGMFTFIIVDIRSGEFFVARDRLGIKPLYYTKAGDKYIFSSEIAPILTLCDRTEIDEFGLRQYKKLRAFFNGRTLYKGISMFPAGAYMKAGAVHRYWELPRGPKPAPADGEVRELMESAVRYRRISDVEVGSYLSGGVDSTIVAGLSHKPHTWTVGFKENNEFEWAKLAAAKFGSKHHEVPITSDQFLDLTKDLITVRREPLSVPNEVLLYRMTQEVKKFNTVVLSGEGADELFFGYDRIFRWANETPEFDLPEFDEHYSYSKRRDDAVVEDAIAPFMDRGRTIDTVAAFFQVAHLHGLLRRVDNSTMRCSVEARVPFVDYRLVERMAGVSFDYRMQDGIVKTPLKRIFADVLPDSIIERKKVGFPVDLKEIFRDYGKEDDSPMDKWFKFNLEVLGIED
jgi:asparagine synthase (glutamine-hydrolysing)